MKKSILRLSCFCDSGNEIFISVNRDPEFFMFVNGARDPPARPVRPSIKGRDQRSEPRIWNHNEWDRKQRCFSWNQGSDQTTLDNNKNMTSSNQRL